MKGAGESETILSRALMLALPYPTLLMPMPIVMAIVMAIPMAYWP